MKKIGTSQTGGQCNSCNGRGRKSCFSCNSSGFQECRFSIDSFKIC